MTEQPLPIFQPPPAVGQSELERIVRGQERGRRRLEARTAWRDLQLINGWLNFDSGLSLGGTGRTARIIKIGGLVYFEGVIRSGTIGTVAFVVPSGYRHNVKPAGNEHHWPCASNNAFGLAVTDATTGNVLIRAGSNVWFDLSGLGPWLAER